MKVELIKTADNIIDFQDRYYVYCYDNYYPKGGMHDLQGTYNDIQACAYNLKVLSSEYDNIEIFDTEIKIWIKLEFPSIKDISDAIDELTTKMKEEI